VNEENGLKERTKQFALRIIRLFGSLPKSTEDRVTIIKRAKESA
jgi:hypothetical protein